MRGGPNIWERDGRPEHLRRALENSLRRLKVEQIDLYQYHAVDPQVPLVDALGELARLKEQGKIRHIGLSNVSVEQLEEARGIVEIASVQNRYNLAFRKYDDVVDACEAAGIGFIPWYPLATGDLTKEGHAVAEVAERVGAKPSQVALAWLLQRSPVMLPIPGTSSVAHLEENMAAEGVELSAEDVVALDAIQAA